MPVPSCVQKNSKKTFSSARFYGILYVIEDFTQERFFDIQ